MTSVNYYTIIIFITGLVFVAPVRDWITAQITKLNPAAQLTTAVYNGLYLIMFVWCIVELAQSSYNPFIYFRF